MPGPTAEKRASGLINAAAAGDLVRVKSLIAAGEDVNGKTDDGETALMWAVWGDHAEVVEALLTAGAEVNAKAKDGRTALKIAQVAGHTRMVKLLRQAGGKE
jgi:ankyrin repeat protein